MNSHQCRIGWAIYFVSYFLMGYILSLIWLYRVKVIFAGSAFEYPSWIYKFFHVLMILIIILYFVCFAILFYRDHWILYNDERTYLYFCNFDIIQQHAYFRAFFLFSYVPISAILLYLFVRGLWLLDKEMISRFAMDHVKDRSTSQVSLDVVLDKYSEQQCTLPKNGNKPVCTTAASIVELHSLIKKATILVCVAMSSATIHHIWVAIDEFATQLFGIDVVINVLCVWFMCASSVKFWNCCKKHGLCMICYRKENRSGL